MYMSLAFTPLSKRGTMRVSDSGGGVLEELEEESSANASSAKQRDKLITCRPLP